MLISTGNLASDTLRDRVAVVTGAGRGIGLEAARSLVWLGAKAVVAELDAASGSAAADAIQNQLGRGTAAFIQTDVGDEQSVANLRAKAEALFGRVDIVLNNATITPMGAVKDRPIKDWDASYRVNLRGPVLLAQAFLPDMIRRRYGVFVCVSSVGQAYMGAYETFKAAQVHLAETLDAELEGTGVFAFTIGPGLVKTPGAEAGIAELAPLYGKTVEEFYAMSKEHIISPEEAGAGFAAAAALAEQFGGQEIASKQGLLAAGISLEEMTQSSGGVSISAMDAERALSLCRIVRSTLADQASGWAQRPFFERQWMVRDFRKNAGMSVERWLEALTTLEQALQASDRQSPLPSPPPLDQLAAFYAHLQKLAAGYEKDQKKLEEDLSIIESWQTDVESLRVLVGG